MLGKNSDNGADPAIQIDGPADNGSIAIKIFAPETIVENGHLIGIGRKNAAPIQHRNAQHGEVILSAVDREDAMRFHAVVEVGEGLFVLANHILK